MKLKADHKTMFLAMGIISTWFAVAIMLGDFYEGVVNAVIVTVRGGTYHPYYD